MDCLKCGEETTEDEIFCTRCIDNGWIKCESCGEISDNPNRGTDGESLCEECFNDEYNVCDDCGRTMSHDNSYNMEDSTICSRCYDRDYFYCERCQTDYHRDEYGSDGVCSDCESHGSCPNIAISSLPASQEEIQEMADMLISGTPTRRKYYIAVNNKDYGLAAIAENSESTGIPFYLYGLKDRPEYQLAFSSDIYGLLSPIAKFTHDGILLLPSPIGWISAVQLNHQRRYALGVCKSLRAYPDWIISLIKTLGEIKSECREMARAA